MDASVIDPRSGTRLDRVIDPGVMGAVFRRLLPASDCDIVDCRIARYRHRPGARCLVQYAISVRDRSGVITDEHVTGQWHHSPDRAAAIFRKLSRRAADDTGPAWTSPFAPVFFDAESGMLATTYPWDRRMPALPRIAAGRAPELLAPMLAWLDAEPAALVDVQVSRIRYREQLNAVCRYTLSVRRDDATTEHARFFVKAYPDDGGARAAGLLAVLERATRLPDRAARVSKALAYVDALGALVLAEAAGTPLDRLSPEPATAASALRLVATALAAFGAQRPALVATAPDRDRGAATARSIQALAVALPTRRHALDRLRGLGGAMEASGRTAGLTHGDLKLEHVFIHDGAVELIDLDSCRLADPLWDLALLQARWWAARDADAAERPLGDWGCQVLADAYLTRVPGASGQRLPTLGAMAALDVAAGVVKRAEPDWAERATRLVDRALVVVDGRR